MTLQDYLKGANCELPRCRCSSCLTKFEAAWLDLYNRWQDETWKVTWNILTEVTVLFDPKWDEFVDRDDDCEPDIVVEGGK